jgi:hypothetical protein
MQSDNVDTILATALRKLYLPPISQAERGWNSLLVDKTLHMIWNAKPEPEYKVDVTTLQATALGANFTQVLQPLPGKIWDIQALVIKYVATATVGTRNFYAALVKSGYPGAAPPPLTYWIMPVIFDAPTANQNRNYNVGKSAMTTYTYFNANTAITQPLKIPSIARAPGSGSAAVTIQLAFFDFNSVDALDQVSVQFYYTEDDLN